MPPFLVFYSDVMELVEHVLTSPGHIPIVRALEGPACLDSRKEKETLHLGRTMNSDYALNAAQKRKITDTFFCKFLGCTVTVAQCLDDYMNANALNIKNSPCFKCAHGLKMRGEFAGHN